MKQAAQASASASSVTCICRRRSSADAPDLLHQLGMGAQELAEGFARQHQQAAVAEGHHVGDPRLAHDQRHLAEEIAGAEANHLLAGPLHLDRARGDEVHGVAALALADDPFARQGEPWHQQGAQVSPCLLVEPAQQRHVADQNVDVEAEVEWRDGLEGFQPVAQLADQVSQQLGREQALRSHALVGFELEPHGRAAEEPARHRAPVGRVLQPDGVQRAIDVVDPRLDDMQGDVADALAEQRADAAADEADQAFQHAPLDQPQLDPLRHAARQRPVEAKAAVEKAGELKRQIAADLVPRRLAIGLDAAIPDRVQQLVGPTRAASSRPSARSCPRPSRRCSRMLRAR